MDIVGKNCNKLLVNILQIPSKRTFGAWQILDDICLEKFFYFHN